MLTRFACLANNVFICWANNFLTRIFVKMLHYLNIYLLAFRNILLYTIQLILQSTSFTSHEPPLSSGKKYKLRLRCYLIYFYLSCVETADGDLSWNEWMKMCGFTSLLGYLLRHGAYARYRNYLVECTTRSIYLRNYLSNARLWRDFLWLAEEEEDELTEYHLKLSSYLWKKGINLAYLIHMSGFYIFCLC